jgi:CubicO group peptidase (beta-lactamase class C family)
MYRSTPRFRARPFPLPLPALLPLLLPVLLLADPAHAAAQSAPLAGLDQAVAEGMRDWQVPGLALAVVRGDSVLFMRGYGTTRIGGTEPVDAHTNFAIASTSKAFTTAALAQLVDEGRLGWDDPVSEHLPWFALDDPYVTRALTIRDLVTHRAGAARFDNLWIASDFDRRETLERLRHLPQANGFRDRYGYNNHLYIVAGEVVGELAGSSWDDVLDERIFGPLGMGRSTSRTAVVEARGNVAESHTRVAGGVQAVPRRDYDNIGGAGAVWSNAHDLSRWMRMHLNRGTLDGVRILDEERFDEMYAPQTVIPLDSVARRLHPTNHFAAYALGWRVQDFHGRKLVHHSGSINYTRTHVTLVPDEGIGIAIIANQSSSNLQLALTWWILDALQGRQPADWSGLYLELQARNDERSARTARELEEARLPGAGPSLAPEGYAGRYEDPLFGEVRVTAEGEGLVLRYSSEYVADLEHWHQDQFRANWRRPGAGRTFARFHLDTRGRVTAVEVDGFAEFGRVDEG